MFASSLFGWPQVVSNSIRLTMQDPCRFHLQGDFN